ncbi:MAG: anti-sigma factor antagonist [Eubacterium sp.]|nr:anti-sigma factor antagonist [Eubacterium sp.]
MISINGEKTDNTLKIVLDGRIDSTNAADVEKQLDDIVNENSFEELIIDAQKLEYISSAGLRIILRLKKNNASLKIINVSSDVYEIFEMTGFSEIMPIEKAYREFSVEGCEIIGQGANGKVYRIDPETIIKVYNNPDSLPDIKRERELARKAFVLGIPTAIPYDVVKVGDGYGSVFELLNAKSFAKLIEEDPDNIDEYIGLYIDLLKKIHSTEVVDDEVPSMKEVAVGWAKDLVEYLPNGYGEKLVQIVESIPDSKHMMHGDYHIKNVMMQNGETLLIDMDTICTGEPVFELASMFNAYVGFGSIDASNVENFLGLSYDRTNYIWEKSLELYCEGKSEEEMQELKAKAEMIGYARIMRRTIRRGGLDTEDGQELIDFCRKQIESDIDYITQS